jgi:phosphoribosylformimino-5-aminoimidazole carboxamide ribotide isomerase
MVTGGSIAVRDRERFLGWLSLYGPGRIILGADFRDGKVAVSGWHETTGQDLREFISGFRSEGIEKVICTDIDRDGMLEGPSTELYRTLKKDMEGLYLVASGGISGIEDVEELEEADIDGVIIGKAIYEGKLSLKTLESFISNNY